MTLALNTEPVTTVPCNGLDLIGRARSGDCEAFDELCREHGDRLLRQAMGLCGDAGAAEDLVQETFVEAWRCLGRYHGACRFFTWLCSILIHRHRSSRRKRWPVPFSLLFGGERETTERFLADVPDPTAAPGVQSEQAEQAARVLRSLEKLPARQREVVYLRFYAEDSLEGIAAALGCPVGTVKSRLFHGLERLRQLTALRKENDV
ncbi:MAG TPA: sigma-70 family RNA polymerase sigma factor [Verrucomicrobiota bacterium]|nr:sigma-70 family RNA polymerase sigma factor [Verrucomicrobiota bacterium]